MMNKSKLKLSKNRAAVRALMSVALILFAGDAVLAATSMTMGQVATNITGSFESITRLITATAYLAGMGFAVGAIIKFKAHKDNPAQVPIGQPIGLLVVAAALLFLPTISGVTGQSIFGASRQMGGPKGVIVTE